MTALCLRLTVALAVLTFAVAPLRCGAMGQSVEQYRAHVDSLYHQWHAAALRADSAEKILSVGIRLDSIWAGPVLVLVQRDSVAIPEHQVRRAGEEIGEQLRQDTVLLRSVSFYFSSGWRREGKPQLPDREVVAVPVAYLDANYGQSLITSAHQWLTELVDSSLTQWSGQRIPLIRSPISNAQAWTELTLAPSSLARDCLERNVNSCKTALGLTNVSDSIADWYDADSRRALVASLPGLIRNDVEAADVCLKRGWDQVCWAILERMNGVPAPLPYEVRGHLLWHVLSGAEDGVYQRLVRHSQQTAVSASPSELLEIIGGQSVDDLIRAWQVELQSARPSSATLPGLLGIFAFVWFIGVGTASLLNSRWR